MTPPEQKPSPDQMRIAAATVLYRPDAALAAGLFDALAAAELTTFVFVNGALSEEPERLLNEHGNLVILRSPENIGLGAALNRACESAIEAGFSHVLLFDQDSSPDAQMPSELGRRFLDMAGKPGPGPAALGPVLRPPEGEGFRPLWYSRRAPAPGATACDVDFLPTSGTLVALRAWQSIGPFRADFFIDGIDVEWCFRAWHRGFRCVLAEDVSMPHRWGTAEDEQTPQILRQSPVRTYYYLRNAAYSLRLPHFPLRWKMRVAARLFVQSLLLLGHARFDKTARQLVVSSIAAGLRGSLGPMPAGVRTG